MLLQNKELVPKIKSQLEKVHRDKNSFIIHGRVFTENYIILNGTLQFIPRDKSSDRLSFDVNFEGNEKEHLNNPGRNSCKYVSKISLKTNENCFVLVNTIYDVYLNLKLINEKNIEVEVKVRVGRPTLKTKIFTNEATIYTKNSAQIIKPYYTFKQSNLSFEVYNFTKEIFDYLRKVMRWSWILKLIYRRKGIWIVGERPYKAQDTGYHFFKYIRNKHSDKEVYYVIDKESPEKHNIELFGNILEFGSKRHILYSIIAKKIISSHHPDYLYPIRTNKFKRKISADKVFLQHGVLGTKNMVANYGKNSTDFETDLFLVSSDYEKDIIVKDFGYSEEEVKVTGLSRFDSLFKDDIELKRQILIIPTWRDWLMSKDIFLESEYFYRYNNLINNQALLDLAIKENINLVFCLHPNMQQYVDSFSHPSVKIVRQGEVNVQNLIKESSIMVTDYSSVAFDFSFLKKPVIYYQFDRNRFLGKRPSHLNIDNDLPGDIVFNEEDIIDLLRYYVDNNFKMKEDHSKRANKFLKYKDCNANERIYNEIVHFSAGVKFISKVSNHYITIGLYKKIRYSKYYLPIVKRLYKLMRKIVKQDKKVILFESGLGKQYADSPRYIYESLITKYNNNYKFIWVYNKNDVRFNNRNTKKIKRLSPAYYYYLAKCGFWVNNQNFPTYIEKPKKTTFLQTWHGTPLKRMLHDLTEIYGRNDDYLERVSGAIKNWDYLISPNEYSTKVFRSAFKFEKEIVEVGYPRNDIFYKESTEKQKEIRSKLGIPKGKKIILYAPTFRDNQKDGNKFSFNLNLDINLMGDKLSKDYVLLLRMHVVVGQRFKLTEEYPEFIFNVSNYPEIQELLLITDILITDYSSVMFDFCNTKKPILFFTYDIKEYRDDLRGFYFDFENKAPGPLLMDTEQVVEAICNLESIIEKYSDKYNSFYNQFCYLDDGDATHRVIENIFK